MKLEFDNRFVRALPADPSDENRPRQVENAAYSRVHPTPVASPRLLAWSPDVLSLLGLPAEPPQELVEVLGGNRLLPGMVPYAARYGGHQFGTWAGQLGDGRAITLGELRVQGGELYELQLKGAGKTPYSRHADGRAVLRSSLREFVCSEAMHHLGVPTTRALSLVATGEGVERDMFYSGNPRVEPGAIVCRVAPSFLRFGNFQIHAARGEARALRALADFTLRRFFPGAGEPSEEAYVRMFDEVCDRTATLIVEWMRVGFVHGVMNTDNMSILGLTIDYGPFGFLDAFDPDFTPNTTDFATRRYRFGHQPAVAHWNLAQLAKAFLPLTSTPNALDRALESYADAFESRYLAMMRRKLGFGRAEDGDEALIADLLDLLVRVETDPTLFFRRLADVSPMDPTDTGLLEAFYSPSTVPESVREDLRRWLARYAARTRLEGNDLERRVRMNAANPRFVPRNYVLQLAIDAAEQDDLTKLHELMDVLRRPYDDQPDRDAYAAKRPDWARTRPGCAALSCSS